MPRAKIQNGSKNIKDRFCPKLEDVKKADASQKSPGNPLSLSVSHPAATELSERRSSLVSQQWPCGDLLQSYAG